MNPGVHSQELSPKIVARIEALGLFHLRLRLQTRSALRLPDIAGPTLRGAFGNALFRQSCPFPEPRCASCEWVSDCAYGRTFETPQAALGAGIQQVRFANPPRPMWLRWESPPRSGEAPGQELSLSVLGTRAARRFLPEVVRAVEGLAANGLGRERSQLDLIAVEDVAGVPVVSIPAAPALAQVRTWRAVGAADPRSVLLRTLSPLRLHRDGHLLADPNAADVAAAAWRRLALLELANESAGDPRENDRLHRDAILEMARASDGGSLGDLRMLRRHSGRSGRRQAFLGFEGDILFVDAPAALCTLLEAGVQTGIGKGIAFGFGSYALVPWTRGARS